jgi:hypothetical protein
LIPIVFLFLFFAASGHRGDAYPGEPNVPASKLTKLLFQVVISFVFRQLGCFLGKVLPLLPLSGHNLTGHG